jgi:hypothetical protein
VEPSNQVALWVLRAQSGDRSPGASSPAYSAGAPAIRGSLGRTRGSLHAWNVQILSSAPAFAQDQLRRLSRRSRVAAKADVILASIDSASYGQASPPGWPYCGVTVGGLRPSSTRPRR